jgi:hypothetical protein
MKLAFIKYLLFLCKCIHANEQNFLSYYVKANNKWKDIDTGRLD